MPYIPIQDRVKFLDNGLEDLIAYIQNKGISNGELNYLITKLGLAYISVHGLSYNTGSDVIKALECAKLEFYHRMLRPYEDSKIRINGDVYPIG